MYICVVNSYRRQAYNVAIAGLGLVAHTQPNTRIMMMLLVFIPFSLVFDVTWCAIYGK